MVDKTSVGIIGVLSALLISGGIYEINQDNAYLCSSDNSVGVFTSLSSTGVTGYYSIDGVRKGKICSGGKWVKITKDMIPEKKITEWECNPNECIPK